MTWDEFDLALAEVLGRIDDGTRLIIQSADTPQFYVQCALNFDQPLTLEAVSDLYLTEGLRRGAAGAAALTAMGWEPPRDTPGNWWNEIDWPGTSSELLDGARRITAALRDVFGVVDPGGLSYTAWREPDQAPLEFPTLEIRQAAGP